MKIKRDIAERVVAVVNSSIAQIVETLPLVEGNVSEAEYKVYKRAVAKAINTMDMEIVRRIAHEHSDLMPWEKKPGIDES